MGNQTSDTIKDFVAALREYAQGRTEAGATLLLLSARSLSAHDTYLLGRVPDLLQAATIFDQNVCAEGSWTMGEISFNREGSTPWRRVDSWSPEQIGVHVPLIVGIHRALNPDWKAPGEE